jgi:hypothetical protein
MDTYEGGPIQAIPLSTWLEGKDAIIREQRRYEIAKECLAGMMSPNMLSFCSANTPHYVRYSIELADALLAELEKKP